jgi:hypothetical protein
VELTGKITLTPFVHRKIYHIQAFAMGFAVAAKAIHRVGFVVYLQDWGFIFMLAC